MAVVEGEKTTQILYKVQTGETSTGEPSYSTRTLSNINPAITAEDAFSVGNAIGNLQKYTLGDVFLRTTTQLTNQE